MSRTQICDVRPILKEQYHRDLNEYADDVANLYTLMKV